MTNWENAACTTVDDLLLDAGHADSPELRATLLRLRSFADSPVPAPGPELASVLACRIDELARKRPLRQHRPTVVSVAVIAGMGLGVSGVAATSPAVGIRDGLVSIQNLNRGWAPDWAASLGGNTPLAAPASSPDQSLQGNSSTQSGVGPYATAGAGDARFGTSRDAVSAQTGIGPARGFGEILDGFKDAKEFVAGTGRHRLGGQADSAGSVEKGQGKKGLGSSAAATEEGAAKEASGQRATESPWLMFQRAAVQSAAAQGMDQTPQELTESAVSGLPGGRHFSQSTPPRAVASAADSIGTWLKKQRRG